MLRICFPQYDIHSGGLVFIFWKGAVKYPQFAAPLYIRKNYTVYYEKETKEYSDTKVTAFNLLNERERLGEI